MPSLKVYLYCLPFVFSTAIQAAPSAPLSEICDQSGNVHFDSQPIFDLSDADTIFLHRWANLLHIQTKQVTLENSAAYFINKCEINLADLEELERHLRHQKFIRDAKVIQDKQQKVSVTTWDNWSLMPTISYGRQGAENTFSIGIKDRNLLGLGIDAQLEYFTDSQRSGYKFDTQFPLYLGHNTEASIRLIDSDDGQFYGFGINKKFVSFDTDYAYNAQVSESTFNDIIFQNGQQQSTFTHHSQFKTAEWGWLHSDTPDSTLRFSLGLIEDKHQFSRLDDPGQKDNLPLPLDRDFLYPFAGIEFLQKDYHELQNIHLINHIEDFNFGWQFNAQLGVSPSKKDNAAQLIFRSSVSKGFTLNTESLLFLKIDFDSESYASRANRLLATFNAELFHKFTPNWGLYIKNKNRISRNQYIDQPVSLGGDTGLRGYPLQYQHGGSSALFSTELRYYPHFNIYKLLELGAVAFIDSGKTFGRPTLKNADSGWLKSVGIGARLYSSQSSEAKVIHLDLAMPLSSSDAVNNIEFRISTNQSF